LFVSPNAEYVSVTVGNRIIILRKRDDYASPCGVYTSECTLFSGFGSYSAIHWY